MRPSLLLAAAITVSTGGPAAADGILAPPFYQLLLPGVCVR